MRRQADRYTLELPVELVVAGKHHRAALQDLSRSGMFLQISAPVPCSTRVHVAMTHHGRRVITTARVKRSLRETTAQALGRAPGVGVAFCDPVDPADHVFAITVDQLIRDRRAAAPLAGLHIVIGDSQPQVLEYISSTLREAGFSVDTATTGMETVAACFRRTPDVVIVDRALSLGDGFHVLELLARDPKLSVVPVIVTSADPGDLPTAFERGAMDFIPKPLSVAEVIARTRRFVANRSRAVERVILRGTIADLGLPALLTMLEQQHKTGRLEVTGDHAAWIDIVDGRIVAVESNAGSAPGDAMGTLMKLLDGAHGTFELTAITGPQRASEFAMPIMGVLLEHARLSDEASRRNKPRSSNEATGVFAFS